MTSKPQFIAYYRVSTDQQGRSGLGLDAQRAAVESFLNGDGVEVLAEYVEVESGRKADRPELAKALAACRKNKARLVIAKLDRLSRSVAFIAQLMESGVDFACADMPTATPLTLHILAAMAEFEAKAISERTRVALKAAKSRGRKLGWSIPSRREEQARASANGAKAIRQNADQHAANVVPVIAAIRAAGVGTLAGVAEALNQRGIKTARGGAWHPTTVKNVLARAEASD